jgi:glycogen(starch) synthase
MSATSKSVVYLSLGEYRVRAALQHTAALAAAGAKVTLLVADIPAWKDASPAPGVTLVRSKTHSWRTVRPLLAAGTDLLLAGDPEAMPIADAARRTFPALEIRTEPASDPDRRPAPADLAVVTPWYPSPNDPYAGSFVQAAVQSVGGRAGSVSILHAEHWFFAPWQLTGGLIEATTQRELDRSPGVTVTDTPEGELTRVVTPQARRRQYTVWADEHIRRMRAVLPTGQIEAPLVHAHTGHFGGAMAVELARPDARIVVTEHASILRVLFAQPAGRQQYAKMLERVERVLCVSGSMREQIATEFPRYAYKLEIVPNPIDFDQFAVRPEMPVGPARWLYAGRILEPKGVLTLVDGFARVAAEDPSVTLTMVGNGKAEDAVRDRVKEHGLVGRVVLRPPVAPEEMTALLHDHDVLVHASRAETFGMTVVEAVATGTPVLVAKSEGPSETLSGLDGVAGTLFPVTKNAEILETGYRRLRELWPALDLTAARTRLRERFGYEAIGAELLAKYREAPPTPGPAPLEIRDESAGRIVVVAAYAPNAIRLRRFIDIARDRGFGIDLIVSEPEKWVREQESGIRVHGIGALSPIDRGPRPARLSGSPLPAALRRTLQVKAKSLRNKVIGRAQGVLRPTTLWLATRPVLPDIDMTKVRRVIVYGAMGERIGWQIAQRYPGVAVSTALKLPPDLQQ